jgi:hypothetical protein
LRIYRIGYIASVKLSELRSVLAEHPATFPRFLLPNGDQIPAHAHITEVGHAVKKFIDCGGLTGKEESVVLQTHVGEDVDHRLRSDRFARILALGEHVLPHDGLDVEVEYDCCVVAQYPITEIRPTGERLDVILGRKATQCRARERSKTASPQTCCATATACC